MRNLSRDLLSSWLAVLLASSVACTKASFVRITDGTGGVGDSGVSGGAGDSGVVDGGAGAGDTAGFDSGGGVGDVADGRTGADSGPEAGVVCPQVPLVCSTSTAGVCDPVCQTGNCNWCTDKCTYALNGVKEQPTCASTGQKTPFQPCTVISSGAPTQHDDCAPGNICLPPIIGDNPTYCFSLCVSAGDCINVNCGPRPLSAAGGSVSVCDPPYDQCGPGGTCCNPISGAGCPDNQPNQLCLLISPGPGTGHSRTVCAFTYGDGRNGVNCNSYQDCFKGNACAPDHTCRQVCNDANPCPSGNVNDCTMWGSEYGYCPF